MKHLTLLLLGALVVTSSPASAAGKLGDAAPPLQISDWIKGGPVELKPGGKIHVIEFWATWCPPCRTSIPHLTAMQKKFKDKVTFVGISDESAATVKPFVAKMGAEMDYVVALDRGKMTSARYMKAFGAEGIPHAFVVDTQGAIVWEGHPMDGLEEVLGKLVEGKFDLKAAQRTKRAEALAEEYAGAIVLGRGTNVVAALGKDFLKEAHGNAALLNNLAWFVLTNDQVKERDVPFALALAKGAVDASAGKDADALDTYARALFDSGRRTEAIEQQKKAIAVCKDAEMKEDLGKTLNRYQAPGDSQPSDRKGN